MIAQLVGVVIDKGADGLVVDVNGVGYLLQVSMTTLATLPPVGSKATVKVHTVVRDDAIMLFGFADDDEKRLFRMLIGVTGIGPKVALTILSGLSAQELAHAIHNREIGRLVRVPGVGKKTAERLVLELSEKLPAAFAMLGGAAGGGGAGGAVTGAGAGRGLAGRVGRGTGPGALLADLAEALGSLGLKNSEIERICTAMRKRAENGATLETLLSEALRM